MNWSGSPKCDEGEVPRVVTALHADEAHTAGHAGVHDRDHCLGGTLRGRSQLVADQPEGGSCTFYIEGQRGVVAYGPASVDSP